MKKLHIIIPFVSLISILAACAPFKGLVVGEYDTTKLSHTFDQSNEAYAIGANMYGMPVFKNPEKALEQALIDYADGFTAIQEEFDLEPVNSENWEYYKTYGWQLTTNDENIRNQGSEITQFF